MTRATSKTFDSRKSSEPGQKGTGELPFVTAPAGPEADVMELHHAAGNRAVSAQIQSGLPDNVQAVLRSPGRALDANIQAEMESKFNHDFSGVRIHTDSQADISARAINAKAYTVGHDIVLAAGQYSPADFSGKGLLSHELAHVIQQERGGVAPQLNPTASHEQDADAAAKAAMWGNGPVTVSGATGVGLARAIDDWLEGTPHIQSWSYTELVDEIDVIQQWLSYQTHSTSESARLEEALTMLQTEARSREKSAVQQPKRTARRPKSGAKRGQQDQAAQGEQPVQKPRILRERTSVHYEDPNEIRQEIDLIMTWLQRDDLSRDERNILQTELQSLAPSLQENRIQRATERRASKIQQILVPQTGNANDRLIGSAKLVDSIQPMSERPGFHALTYGDELIVLQDSEVANIRKTVQQHFKSGADKIKSKADDAIRRYDLQKEVDKDQPVVSFFVHLFGDIDDPGTELRQNVKFALAHAEAVLAHAENGQYERAARFLIPGGEFAAKANLLAKAYVDEIISTAEMTVSVLELTRDLSFSIAIGIGAALAAPVVFSGALAATGGAGLTGATATGVAALGTGTVITGGGALAGGVGRGGASLIGQGLTGDVNLKEVGREFTTGAKRGSVDAATGVVTAGTAGALGKAATTTGRVVKGAASGFTGGATGGGLGAALEGQSLGEVLEAGGKSGLSGAFGGGLGGASSRALSSQSTVKRALGGAFTGGAGGAAGALVTGGSAQDIKQGAIMGTITGGVTSTPSRQSAGLSQRQRPSKSEITSEDIDAQINQLESGGETGGFRAEGPGVRTPVRRSSTHSPTVAQPPTRVLEVGAGRTRTNLGMPTQRSLVATTRTDIRGRKATAVSTRGLHRLDATQQIPPELVGQFDVIVINNPRGYTPNIIELGRALRPGGRIIVQGRGAENRKQRGINPNFQKLLDTPPPPGFRKVEEGSLPPPPTGQPQHAPPEAILGGPFFSTSGKRAVLPNARIIYERITE